MTGERESLFSAPITDRDLAWFVSVLADHALLEIRCDHDAKMDTPVCNCAVVALGAHPTVQAAKEAWALHVWGVLSRRSQQPTLAMLAFQSQQRTGG